MVPIVVGANDLQPTLTLRFEHHRVRLIAEAIHDKIDVLVDGVVQVGLVLPVDPAVSPVSAHGSSLTRFVYTPGQGTEALWLREV